MPSVRCPVCKRLRNVDPQTLDEFGPDLYCDPCADREHREFMAEFGGRLGLTCSPGCGCGFGPLSQTKG